MDYDRLRELQQKFDENPRRYFAPLANEYRKGGQPKRAIEICRAHLAQMPGHMSGQIVYGQSLYEAGEFEEATQVFARALSLDPENLIALRSLGDMSLQAGDTREARSWYSRLLEADPKDTAVIALVSEIDAAEDATPLELTEIPGVDIDEGDQQIPAGPGKSSELVFLHSEPSAPPESEPSAPPEEDASPASASPDRSPGVEPAPDRASSPEFSSGAGASSATGSSATTSSESAAAPDEAPFGLERHYPVQEATPPEPTVADAPASPSTDEGLDVEELGVSARESAADGLTSVMPEAISPLDWSGPPPSASVTDQAAPATEEPDRFPAASAFASAQPEPPTRAPESIARAPEPPPRAPEPPRPEEKTFSSGASSEPFVNETMAQLYLQQGYKQLALQVYRQLVVSRPQDEGLRARIAEIEAQDSAAHPGEVAGPRKETASERPSAPVESAGRQPSIREFFATLGRRRPPAPSSRGRPGSGNNQPTPVDMRPPLGAASTSGNLDSVFAGATVSPADAKAASRLAGAFSGATGSTRTSPPTPPMPTPRVNPRVPQTQESEEDVAKFRAWLDGLTGE